MMTESEAQEPQKRDARSRKTITLRIHKVSVYYSRLELNEIEKKAGKSHGAVSAYVRNASLNYRRGA